LLRTASITAITAGTWEAKARSASVFTFCFTYFAALLAAFKAVSQAAEKAQVKNLRGEGA